MDRGGRESRVLSHVDRFVAPEPLLYLFPYNKDLYRGKGKGRRCCLGASIYSIPCRASWFAPA